MERPCQAPADWNRARYLALAGCVPALSLRLNQLVSETGPVVAHGGRISHCAWKCKALLGEGGLQERMEETVRHRGKGARTPYTGHQCSQ